MFIHCSIDKVMHSLGPKMGYALPKRTLPNPIDITLVFAQKVKTSTVYLQNLFFTRYASLVCTVCSCTMIFATHEARCIDCHLMHLLVGFPDRLRTNGGHHSVFLLLFHGRITTHWYLVLLDSSKYFILIEEEFMKLKHD